MLAIGDACSRGSIHLLPSSARCLPPQSLLHASLPKVSAAGVEIPPGVADYASAMDELRTSRGKSPIEPVFEAGIK